MCIETTGMNKVWLQDREKGGEIAKTSHERKPRGHGPKIQPVCFYHSEAHLYLGRPDALRRGRGAAAPRWNSEANLDILRYFFCTKTRVVMFILSCLVMLLHNLCIWLLSIVMVLQFMVKWVRFFFTSCQTSQTWTCLANSFVFATSLFSLVETTNQIWVNIIVTMGEQWKIMSGISLPEINRSKNNW